jgi:hypothetical protein
MVASRIGCGGVVDEHDRSARRAIGPNRGTVTCPLSHASNVDMPLSGRKADAMSASPVRPPVDPASDIEDEDLDAVLLWTDEGDTWWEPEAGAPSHRD